MKNNFVFRQINFSQQNKEEEGMPTNLVEELATAEINDKMSFEELRKRARKLEGEIDTKLMSFSKLATSYGTTTSSKRTDPEATSLLSGDQMYETLSVEIEQLLGLLSDVNEKLTNSPHGATVAATHILKRHRDILQARRERELLLGGGENGNSQLISGLSRRDLYLKESSHIDNSEHMVEEQISIAMETRDHLRNQRETFKMIQSKVNDLANRFPFINTLISKINIRKRRDSLVIGSVIGICMTISLWWMFF